MRKKRVFMAAMVTSVLLLTGCVDYQAEQIKGVYSSYTKATSDYYRFIQSGKYGAADVTAYKQTEKETTFFLKEKITYHATYTDISIVETVTAPLEQNYYADVKNLVKYAIDDDLDFPNVEELLLAAYEVQKSGTYEKTEKGVTRTVSVLLENDRIKMIMQDKIN